MKSSAVSSGCRTHVMDTRTPSTVSNTQARLSSTMTTLCRSSRLITMVVRGTVGILALANCGMRRPSVSFSESAKQTCRAEVRWVPRARNTGGGARSQCSTKRQVPCRNCTQRRLQWPPKMRQGLRTACTRRWTDKKVKPVSLQHAHLSMVRLRLCSPLRVGRTGKSSVEEANDPTFSAAAVSRRLGRFPPALLPRNSSFRLRVSTAATVMNL